MSYLTQLVRETTARMVPPSTPSWIPALNFAEENTTAEWSGADAPAKHSRPSPSVSAAMEENRNSSLPDKQELPARPRPVRSYQEERTQQPALPLPVQSAADRGDTEALPGRTSQPDRNAVPTQPTTRKREDALALNPPPSAIVYAASTPAPRPTPEAEPSPSQRDASGTEKPRAAVAAPAPEAALTLPAILAEMARRQEVLEARYRKEADTGRLARVSQRPPETGPSPHPQPEAEHLRLNIGSIVVQLEPPPAPRANPPATPPRQPARNFSSRRWARSFADR